MEIPMIAMSVQNYLTEMQIPYELVHHDRTLSSMRTAEAARVPARCIAKAVLLEDGGGYLMAVLPADRHVNLSM
ncbi:MAG TPA: YbaK/EbsC family protein, partial [Burkholderiales bacterium]